MKKKRIVLSLVLSFVFISCLGVFFACKKKEDTFSFSKDLNSYHIEISQDGDRWTGKEKLSYTNRTGDALSSLKFHLYPKFFEEGGTSYVIAQTKMNEAYPNGIDYAKYDVLRVVVGDVDVDVKYSGEMSGVLVVEFSNKLLLGEMTNIEIDFSFELPVGEHRFGYGDNAINLCNFYPIACVYENGDFEENPYHANGDPFYSEVANYNVIVTTDKNLIVAGTGNVAGETTNQDKKTTYFDAVAVRDFAIVLSENFEIVSKNAGDTLVSYYYYEDEYADVALQAGVDAINTFSKLFGKYPYSTFNIVKTGFVHGGMEYPNLVLISDDISNLDDYLNVIVHETAHQWWYGVVGNDEYTYPWLDEALAEYSTCLFYDYNDGYNLNMKDMVNVCHENYALFVSVYTDVLGSVDTSMRAVNLYATEPEYTYCTYVKGVLMFDSLEKLVGRAKFLKSLQNYYKNMQFLVSKPENLINSFNLICKTNLNNFFESWTKGKVVVH